MPETRVGERRQKMRSKNYFKLMSIVQLQEEILDEAVGAYQTKFDFWRYVFTPACALLVDRAQGQRFGRRFLLVSLSPCLFVSLSPCLLFFLSPNCVCDFGDELQLAALIHSQDVVADNRRSKAALRAHTQTLKRHVAAGVCHPSYK